MRSEFLIVAKKLMEGNRRSMSPRELVELAKKDQLFSDNITGKTPHQTMKSKLSTHIRRLGDDSVFIRTGPGRFYLRELLSDDNRPYDSKPLLPPPSTEDVLVYCASELDTLTTWQGINTDWKSMSKKIFTILEPFYFPRFNIESDNKYTQILTYVLVTRRDQMLVYRRGRYNRIEDYLRGSDCVGFGGHVTHDDLDLFSKSTMGITNCARRELNEELILPGTDIKRLREGLGLQVIGIINDDSSDVGRRHLAFVMKYEVSNDKYWEHPTRGEKSITQLRWIRRRNSGPVPLWNYEYWSQLCLREFAPQLVQSGPSYRIMKRRPLKPPRIICMIGPVGSGKTIATGVLRDDFQYSEINTGKVVANLINASDVSKSDRLEFQQRAWDFISRSNGRELLVEELARVVEECASRRVVIDGIRQKDTLRLLTNRFRERGVGVIFVQTPPDLAYKFHSDRLHQSSSIRRFIGYRSAAVEAEVEGLIAQADAVIYNWTGAVRYRESIGSMMEDLGVSRG